jgi:hypothetical protein
MTPLAADASPGLTGLREAAARAGLTVSSSACWPETGADTVVTPLAGFIESNFSPLLAEVAGRALRGRAAPRSPGRVTAVVIVTTLGDVTTAACVASAVDAGRRVSPLLFFQSVPNAVAGYLAARWQLTGPVVCVSGTVAALDLAGLLIEDADADEVLVVRVDLAVTGGTDHAAALLVTGPDGR